MTRNAEEPRILAATFGGLDQATDAFDLPFGKFTWLRNFRTFGRERYMRTRDGYRPVSTRLFSKPFRIPTHWPDNSFWLKFGRDGAGSGGGDTEDGELTIVANPNHDLHASGSNHVNVTFTAYIRGSFTISTYSWDFDYDGITASADASGAASSQTKHYENPGTYVVRVSGTGSDSKDYYATTTIVIAPYDDVTALPTIDAWTSDPYIKQGDSATIEYRTTNTSTVTCDDMQLPQINGSKVVSPTTTTTYRFVATSTGGTAEAFVTVEVEPKKDDGGGGGTPTNAVKINAYADPATIAVGTTANLIYQTQNALAVTLDGVALGSVSGSVGVQPDETTTYVFVATGEGGTTATKSVQVRVTAVPPVGLAGFLEMDPDEVQHNTAFDIAVGCYERGTGAAKEFPQAPVIDDISSVPPGVTFTPDASPTANDGSTVYTFEDCTLELPSGINQATVTLRSWCANYNPAITPAENTFTVIRPTVDFVLTCRTIAEADAPYVEVTTDGSSCTATVYLKIEAQSGGVTATTFNKDVKILPTYVLGWPTSATWTFTNYCALDNYSDINAIAMTGDVVPAAAFTDGDAGICTVKCVLTIPVAAYNNSHFVDFSFDCIEQAVS